MSQLSHLPIPTTPAVPMPSTAVTLQHPQASLSLPDSPPHQEHLFFTEDYPGVPWHPSPSHLQTVLIWQLNKTVHLLRSIRVICKLVKSFAVVNHNEELLNSPFFSMGILIRIPSSPQVLIPAVLVRTVSRKHLRNLWQTCQHTGNWVRQITRLCKYFP